MLLKSFLIRIEKDIPVTSILLLLFTWFLQAFPQLNELSQIPLYTLLATGIRVNRRLILWSRQLCNHSAKGQILPEHMQIQLPMIFFLIKVNSVGNAVHIHMQQTKGIPEPI